MRTYRNSASTVRGYPRETAELIAAGAKLSELPDIGEEKIRPRLDGRAALLEEVAARTPRA